MDGEMEAGSDMGAYGERSFRGFYNLILWQSPLKNPNEGR